MGPFVKRHWFYILLAVSSSPRYGTAIRDDVHDLSDGTCTLWPATLYGSLDELTAMGWLQEVLPQDRPSPLAGRERFYGLTSEGLDQLKKEVARLEGVTGAARARLRGV